ncbi:ArsR family transcriptional regulator, partial [Anaerostipes caccae]|nr:ArsR family transcriptional regulator [Anaerostipes caccae]
MDKDCEKRLSQIVQGFSECKDAFTAFGDETRQLILMVLLESDLSGIRVGEIARK